MACASCHGLDARGGGEAFVRAPDIRWHTLSKFFAPRRVGEARPAYSVSTFTRAIQQGIASNGHLLDPAMPRFDLSQDEIEAVVHFLSRTAESFFDEEVNTKVVLGLLPSSRSQRFSRELGDRLSECPSMKIGARFPPFEILRYESPVDALSQVESKIAEGRASYILAPYIAGWETQYFNTAKDWPIRTLLPVTPLDPPAHPNFVFALPGLMTQVGALLDQGLSRADRVTVLISEDNLAAQNTLQFVRNELRARNAHFEEVVLERFASLSPASSSRWLILAPLEAVAKKLRGIKSGPKSTALVPAMFFDPEAARKIHMLWPGIVWTIAYPYQPIEVRTGRWRSPMDAWSDAGCVLMAMIAEENGQDSVSRQTSIKLDNGITLFNAYADAHRRKQVVVQTWKPSKGIK